MPRGGVAHRSEQSALLAGLIHDRGTDPVYHELLSSVEGSSLVSDADSPEAVNVRELRRDYDRERRIPRKLAEELARVHAFAAQSWAEARTNNDYKSFAPWLEKVFALAREEADAVGYVTDRYDALLDNDATRTKSKPDRRLTPAMRATAIHSCCRLNRMAGGTFRNGAQTITRHPPRNPGRGIVQRLDLDAGY